jgi:hypothetical protein
LCLPSFLCSFFKLIAVNKSIKIQTGFYDGLEFNEEWNSGWKIHPYVLKIISWKYSNRLAKRKMEEKKALRLTETVQSAG